jgi:hypothetical protein
VSANQVDRSELEAEGDRVAAELQLGRRKGAWTHRKNPVALMMAGRHSSQERLFQFDQGIAQFVDKAAEPVVLRWTDLASLTLRVISTTYEKENPTLRSCVLRDSAGRAITVDHKYGVACEQITAVAAQMLGPRLAPALIARFEAGEPITFGSVIIDQFEISFPGDGIVGPWSARWQDMSDLDVLVYGHRIIARAKPGKNLGAPNEFMPHPGPGSYGALGGGPNDFLAQDVITHAARRAGVEVRLG